MLMAVASYHLWLHWREPGLELARLFTDYEPGIHWSQVQMQSGTTGINTIRIYNPVKQGKDQDPAVIIHRELNRQSELLFVAFRGPSGGVFNTAFSATVSVLYFVSLFTKRT